MRAVYPRFVKWLAKRDEGVRERRLEVGESTAAKAWTDGLQRIWLARRLLSRLARHPDRFALEALMTLVHEHCHDAADYDSHQHSAEFYRKYHDWVNYECAGLMQCALRLARETRKALAEAKASPAAHAAPSLSGEPA
jgi:hypothetical protein